MDSLSTEDVKHVATVAPEIITWIIGVGATLLAISTSLAWFFIKKVFSMKDQQHQLASSHLSTEIRAVRKLVEDEQTAAAMKRHEMNKHFAEMMNRFETKADRLKTDMDRLDFSVKHLQEKTAEISNIQGELKDISLRFTKTETAFSIFQDSLAKNFGKVKVKP